MKIFVFFLYTFNLNSTISLYDLKVHYYSLTFIFLDFKTLFENFCIFLYNFYLNSTISLYDLKVNIIFVYSFNKQEYLLN